MSDNPLKQYFRRPALHMKLPSNGIGYKEGAIDMPPTGDIPIYPMTAIDEITARTPDALFNGTAVAELIRSCAPNIKDPWSVLSTDLDALLIGIKSASQGNELEMESDCPKCNETHKYGVNLTAMLVSLKSGDYTKELNIDDLYFKLRPLTYKEMNEISMNQFEIQQSLNFGENDTDEDKLRKQNDAYKKVVDLTIDVLAESIEYIKTPNGMTSNKDHILEFLKSCDRKVYAQLRDYSTSLKEQTEMPPLDLECLNPDCKNQYQTKFTLNITDFFG